LDAHHYTDGLEFLRQGTPTNNTDDRRAAYDSEDPGHQRSFGIQNTDAASTGTLDNNALRTGNALGLPSSRIDTTLGRIARAAERDDFDARCMNTALWPVGWGYYLSNMIGPETGLKTDSVDWAKDHFLNYVRAAGPLPTLRCGQQPYGILPVTSLDLWQAGTDPRDSWLRGLLLLLRDQVWRSGLGAVARIGARQGPPDPDADLADVMRLDGLSSGYWTRHIFGKHLLDHLSVFMDHSTVGAGSDPAQQALLGNLGISPQPRLTHLWNTPLPFLVSAPLIQSGEVSPWIGLSPVNYISTLLGLSHIDDIIAARPDPQAKDNTTPLLQVLLRHSLLLEIARAAALINANESGADPSPLLRDAELIDLVTGQATPTMHWRRQLDSTASKITGIQTVRQYLEGLAFSAPQAASLGQFRTSLARLQTLDSEALLYLMQGTLDLSAHRLDAWITSLATKRLSAMQPDGPTGQYVGAYGWVENLKPTATVSIPVTAPPTGEPGLLVAPGNDSGFIHAPSLAHAATAAVLRNAHLGPAGTPAANGPFAIDLSSRRVRESARILEGVRAGQPLGALLGYRFERALRDSGYVLDRFIAPLRNLAPLVARARDGNTGPVESIAANNVVDGLTLSRRYKEERALVTDTIAHAGANTGEFMAVLYELENLTDLVDGIADALTAEAAYQMVRGNTSRVSATLAAISQGDAPPPQLEVARIPRSGTALSHRVLLLMSGSSGSEVPGWSGSACSLAEPMLNSWAAQVLGDSTKIRCTVERLDDTGAVAETQTLKLSDLLLAPLDVVYAVEAETGSTQPASLSELEQRVLYISRYRAGGFDTNANLRLQHARPNDLAAGEITLFDVLEQARALRRLLASARALSPEDLIPPERTNAGTIDLVSLQNIANEFYLGLKSQHKGLVAQTTAAGFRVYLLELAAYNIAGTIPISSSGDDPATTAALQAQAQAALKISAARLSQYVTLNALPAATDQRARCKQLMDQMQAIFGSSFVVLPRITCDTTSRSELANALAASTQAQSGDPLAANTWFARYACVRNPLAQMGTCLQKSEVLGASARLNLSVAQLPYSAEDRWVALPLIPGTTLPPGKVSLVIHTINAIDTTQPLTGLCIDEWTEVVPNTQETTGITFQFDTPGACAPQTILIAVPPVPGQDWTAETLRHVLMETLDLAKLRAVDSSLLGAAAQASPGLYLAFNAADDAVSTDFMSLTN
jgi:hypothetical protein